MALPELILASTSPYRRDLLQRLQIPFRCVAPDVDESPLDQEGPQQLVERLALAKARAVLARYPQSLVIGADQMACCAGRILGKPGSSAQAEAQLQWMQGRQVEYLNGIAVVDDRTVEQFCVPYYVQLRSLSPEAIHRYVEKDQPLDCAGSFRSEGLGIALVEKMEGADPHALMGMPLIAIAEALRRRGYQLP
ncbi:nucleoside triphosphate pyrophosphatase [Acidithiobacillus montserratensis]|uniref:Nucleoside triphosphate pyrophosphatase n=1 Tax=Acidithiobacillus montserratensis TaxID=2729135 RepID=A0ACD5HBU9_9PROT|nr:nucleoside triphosphate pyrophosphatase [Acidithiobacillus montserratensis]MBN2680325.1 septum formation inhibitor Maf [Acidithiobacillaceae bacterium]MBU2746780.1 septum formation inhibitor Maf [Acidithiobacillus montserratensis]